MTKSSSIIVMLAVAIAAIWCVFEILAVMEINDQMMGFHPLVFFALPVGFVLSAICAVVSYIRKSIAIGFISWIPVVALMLPVLFAYQLSIASWSKVISDRSEENQSAIETTDFSSAEFYEIPYKDHERMVPVYGFQWPNASEMSAAKNGVFFGFTVDGVPHVYIHPIRNGCRGVAWITDTNIIGKDSRVKYEYSGCANWYIWTL